MSGFTIGAGSAIGARATTLKDEPSCSVMVGRPGRPLWLHLANPRLGRPQAMEWGRFRSTIRSTKPGAGEAIEGMAVSDPADPDRTLNPEP